MQQITLKRSHLWHPKDSEVDFTEFLAIGSGIVIQTSEMSVL